MKKKKDFTSTWKVLLWIMSALYLIMGLAMLIFDTRYYEGVRYLITSIVGFIALSLITKKKYIIKEDPMFNLGFIFSVVGVSVIPVMWALGIVFFASSLFKKK